MIERESTTFEAQAVQPALRRSVASFPPLQSPRTPQKLSSRGRNPFLFARGGFWGGALFLGEGGDNAFGAQNYFCLLPLVVPPLPFPIDFALLFLFE